MPIQATTQHWRRILILSGITGAAFALTFLLASATIDWYRSQPRPWNTTAIRATFDSLDTEDASNALVFYYVLENMTHIDYEVADKSKVVLSGKLHSQNALGPEYEYATMNYPLFIPARKRIRIGVHIPFQYEDKCTEQIDDAAARRAEGSIAFVPDVPSETIESLARRIRSKFKACQDYEDEELVQVVTHKFPVYRDWLVVEERQKLRSQQMFSSNRLSTFVNKELPNLEGFVLFDRKNRVQINLPKGW